MRELPIPRIVVNPWQFLTRSKLTPAHRLAVRVDEYAVRLSLLHERFLVATISLDQFCARISFVFRLRAPPVTVHTPTRIRSRRWMSLEEALEIAPCPFGELLRRVFRVSRHCDNRICLSTIPAHNNIERQSSSPHVFGQGIRVREAVAALTRMCGYGSRSVGSLGQELSDGFVSVVALTDFHQAGKMEFHPGFDFARRNVVATRFQTLRQLFGTTEHPHRLAADIHLEKKRFALTGLHAINLGDDRMNRTPFRGEVW